MTGDSANSEDCPAMWQDRGIRVVVCSCHYVVELTANSPDFTSRNQDVIQIRKSVHSHDLLNIGEIPTHWKASTALRKHHMLWLLLLTK